MSSRFASVSTTDLVLERAGRRWAWVVALHHGVLVAALLCGLGAAIYALVWALKRPPYTLLFMSEGKYWLLVTGLTMSTLLGAMAVVGRCRAWRSGRWKSISLAWYRMSFYVLAIGTATFLLFFQPYKALHLLMFWGVFFGIHALLVVLADALIEKLSGTALGVLDVIMFHVCFYPCAAEFCLRTVAMVHPSPLFAAVNMPPEQYTKLYRMQPGSRLFGFPCDSRGFYDKELAHSPNRDGAEEILVAAIGDSFSIGIVPHYFHYTTVAEREERAFEIYNAGIVAIGPAEYIRILEKDILPQNPDCILVSLFLGNDIVEARRFQPRWDMFRRVFDRGSILMTLVPPRLLKLRDEERDSESGIPPGKINGQQDSVQVAQAPGELEAQYPWLADPSLEVGTFSPANFLALETQRAFEICDTETTEFYAAFFRSLQELKRQAGKIPLLVMLIPDEFQVEDEFWNSLQPSGRETPLDRDQPQRLVKAWLRKISVPCLDLLPHMRRIPKMPDGKRHLYHLRDTHFNRRGNQVTGLALARFLRAQLIQDK